ncbi:glycosyltransferase family 2 protein [Parahalioglobus pacificus]|uniref:Glycosyltransferase 2-like domain-containing protein n=1 Tax=Parahalioglobus pacificus TaxID=930806 RepID=A0A919CJU5_9GAMM|nr:glycosyltransferase [Halioglobus pacificus]GHD31923.1 hypothetical protein GCM10007053_15490 [Halioglobus pacificus]
MSARWIQRFWKDRAPRLSIVVVVYDMVEQAKKTVISLSPEYQSGITGLDYEVIIVENSSRNMLPEEFTRNLPQNFRYFARQESSPSPVNALNFGAAQATAEYLCIMVDGARMLTPGVLQNLIRAQSLGRQTVATVPSYHLGSELQQLAVKNGYGEKEEEGLLTSIEWPKNAYRLFEVSCLSKSCERGHFLPSAESNCISLPIELWNKLGGGDARFDSLGGGFLNLDLYKRALEDPDSEHVILVGEGSFHQFHGGATTGGVSDQKREQAIELMKAQYASIRGCSYTPPCTDPIVLGKIPDQALDNLSHSIEKRRQVHTT